MHHPCLQRMLDGELHGSRPLRRIDRPAQAGLGIDGSQRFTWPLYATGLRARLARERIVLVIYPGQRRPRWAAQPIGLGGGSVFTPVVIGAEGVLVVEKGAGPGA